MGTQTYRFGTFQELFETVPAERLRDCMAELTDMMFIAKSSEMAIRQVMADQGQSVEGPVFRLPEVLEWVDDGKREVGAVIPGGGTVILKPSGTEAAREAKC